MLLTISTTMRPATDLGYLLHKHPDRVQHFSQSFGRATVFYPEASDDRCTAALLLEIDPVRLTRTLGRQSTDFALAHYVNDRPYAASSLFGVALADVFSTARAGVCKARQQLADSPIPLTIDIPVLPCRGGPEIAHRIFEPLGWQVSANPIPLDPAYPDWGISRYVHLTLSGTMRLADALSQLHVLLPVLDESKHYWEDTSEVDKLMRSGSDWLASHPEMDLIVRRYLTRSRELTELALERLIDDGAAPLPPELTTEELVLVPGAPEPDSPATPLRIFRHEAVLGALERLEARSVLDLGCGPGALLLKLVKNPQFTKIAGTDVSTRALRIAAKRLHFDELSERAAERLSLFQSALTYEDDRFSGFDAAVLMEVIEHVDLSRLPALERVVFGAAKPGAVVVTTPNVEYNVLYPDLEGVREPDHRFEWNRATFAEWAARICENFGYAVEISGIGEAHETYGAPTQMAVFTRE